MNLFENSAEPIAIASPVCTIRRGQVADADSLAAFAARTFIDTYGQYNRAEDLRLHLDSSYGPLQQAGELADPDVATLLAYRQTELVAFAQVRRSATPPCVAADAPVELHRFYVGRAWHGCGVSQRLLAAAGAAARAFGGATLWLKVWERNARAIAFYRKASFEDVGTADFFVGTDRQTDRVLVMDLRSEDGATRPAAALIDGEKRR